MKNEMKLKKKVNEDKILIRILNSMLDRYQIKIIKIRLLF